MVAEGDAHSRLVEREATVLRCCAQTAASQALGGQHMVQQDQRHQLGLVLAAQGRLPEAEQALQQAWAGRKALLGARHPMTHQSLRELTDVMRRSGFKAEALELLDKEMCHSPLTRHPRSGSAVLNTGASFTEARPRAPRSLSGSSYPTRGPGPPEHNPELERRSWSMGARLRRREVDAPGAGSRSELPWLSSAPALMSASVGS